MSRKTKKTMRTMRPLARKLVATANALDILNRRLISLASDIHDLEFEAEALRNFSAKVRTVNEKTSEKITDFLA